MSNGQSTNRPLDYLVHPNLRNPRTRVIQLRVQEYRGLQAVTNCVARHLDPDRAHRQGRIAMGRR